MKYTLFLQWWLIFTIICVLSIFTSYAGFAKEIWVKDSSYISYFTYIVFLSIRFLNQSATSRIFISIEKILL